MGIRFREDLDNTDLGSSWRVEIHDLEYADSIQDLVLSDPYFEISWDKEGDDLYAPVKASSAEIYIESQSGDTALLSFYDDLRTAEEGRFYVKIYRGDGGDPESYSLYWVGRVFTDGVSRGVAYPYTFTLSATDGLGILKDIDYDDEGTLYSGAESFIGMILKALDKTGIPDLYGATDDLLEVCSEWYNVDHDAITVDTPPLEYSRIDHATFYQEAEDEDTLYKASSAYDVLENILKGWGARIIYANGLYRIIQLHLYQSTDAKYAVYDKSGTRNNAATHNVTAWQEELDGVNIRELSGGQIFYHPAAKKVKAVHYHAGSYNRLPNQRRYSTAVDVGGFAAGGGSKVKIKGVIKLTVTNRTAATVHNKLAYFQLFFNIGANYLKKTALGQDTTWSTSYNAYQVSTMLYQTGIFTTDWQRTIYIPISVVTPSIPAGSSSGNEFRLIQGGWMDTNGNPVSITDALEIGAQADPYDAAYAGKFVYQHECKYFELVSLVNGKDPWEEDEYLAVNPAVSGYENSKVIDLGSIKFGDKVEGYEPGRIEVRSAASAVWADATEGSWDAGTLAGSEQFTELLVKEVASQYRQPLKVQSTALYGIYDIWKQLKEGDISEYDYWVFNGGKLNAARDEISGEWIAVISRDISAATSTIKNLSSGSTPGDDVGNILEEVLRLQQGVQSTLKNVSGITSISSDIDAGSPITSIPIDAVGSATIKAGQSIILMDPVTGGTDTFTVAADVGAGDTSISVSSKSPDNNYGAGAVILYPSSTVAQAISDVEAGAVGSGDSNIDGGAPDTDYTLESFSIDGGDPDSF